MNVINKLIHYFSVVIVGALFSVHSLANEAAQDVVGVQELSILGIGCHLKDSTCYITVDKSVGIVGECFGNSIRWNKSEINGQEILSMYLASSMAGKRVKISVHPSSCFNGNGRYPTFNYMSIITN